MKFISNDKKQYLSLEDELKQTKSVRLTFANTLVTAGSNIFSPVANPVARDMVEKRLEIRYFLIIFR